MAPKNPKPINRPLLWKAMVWVQYRYACLPETEKPCRPQRPYQAGDGEQIKKLIQTTRSNYHTSKKEGGSAVDFQDCKDGALEHWQNSTPGWNLQTRNFYSSVISTYCTWSRTKIPQKARTALATLLPFADYTQLP